MSPPAAQEPWGEGRMPRDGMRVPFRSCRSTRWSSSRREAASVQPWYPAAVPGAPGFRRKEKVIFISCSRSLLHGFSSERRSSASAGRSQWGPVGRLLKHQLNFWERQLARAREVRVRVGTPAKSRGKSLINKSYMRWRPPEGTKQEPLGFCRSETGRAAGRSLSGCEI